MNKSKKLTELFIEDLGQVNGGYNSHRPDLLTTLAVGEESHVPEFGSFPPPPRYTTLAIGEEGGEVWFFANI
ncbi:hypothetical protein MNBD_GAMMA16-2062 [hydrothermal vent metagenome]|uniref:Uncharacterized protein n=1 Tax=hydrothermal vent metagenome TaxID=652676 RepID=A0A3B0Z3Q7_9ZZZZ